jgi:phenylacetate-CoA ligase
MIGELMELRQLRQNPKLGLAEIEALQQRKLHAIIRHAYAQVPYYRSLFDSVGLHPEDIHTVDDLKRIPITTKDDLRAAGVNKIIARDVKPSACISAVTTGSTGKPFRIYLSHSDMRTYRLIAFRALLSIGLRPQDRLAIVGITRPQRTRLYQRLGLYQSMNIHPQLPPDEQCNLLRQINPTVLWFYPTALRPLLRSVDDQLSSLIRPRMLITGAEVLDDNLRVRIQADLDIEIFNFYGAVEIGRIAAECPAHEGLHVNVDHVILESVDGVHAVERGKPGVAVVTALNNFTMPLIRYRLGDICTLLDGHCACGSFFPLMAPPIGREEEPIILPSGKELTPQGIHPIFRKFNGLDQYRLIQESYDELLLQIVWRSKPQEEHLSEIRARFDTFLGEPIRLHIQSVDSIPEEKLKFRAFISRLPK